MDTVLTAVRGALLAFSLFGYVHTVSRRIAPPLAVGTALVSIAGAMYCAGLLNVLPQAAWAICLTGALLALRAIRRREPMRPLLCWGTVFFLLSVLWLAVLLYGSKFTQYDNFTHWGRITTRMLRSDRLPNFQDAEICFPSYPPGSACFIYYVAYLLGDHREWVQILAQNILTAGLLAGLFTFARRWEMKLTGTVVALMLPVCNIALNDLLVDTLLPVAALGGMALCLCYRERLAEKMWWTVPYTVFLITVKNSGVLFAALIAVYCLVCVRRQRRALPAWAGCAACPALALLLWRRHVQLVFENGMSSNHAMDLGHFGAVLAGKSPEDIRTIAGLFVREVFSPADPVIWLLVLLAALAVLSRLTADPAPRRAVGRIAGLALAFYVPYMLGLFAMYLLSMPLGEALTLAGYGRYHMSALIFLAGLLYIGAAEMVPPAPADGKGRAVSAAVCVLCCALTAAALRPHFSQYIRRQDLTGSVRAEMEQLIAEDHIPTGKKYILLRLEENDTDSGYLINLADYLLEPAYCVVWYPDFLQDRAPLLNGYDYLIAFDQGPEIQAYMQQTFGDGSLRCVDLTAQQD